MATKPTTPTTQQASALGFVAPSRPPAGVGPSAALTGWRPYFVFLAHPGRVQIADGEFLPDLALAKATPGRNNNGPNDFQHPTGAVAALGRRGYQPVPEDIVFEAFGTQRQGYRDWYETTSPRGMWLPAWERPRVVGGMTRISCDVPTRRNFERSVKTWLLGSDSEYDSELIEVALEGPLAVARDYLARPAHPGASMRLSALIAAIPASHLPADLKAWKKE